MWGRAWTVRVRKRAKRGWGEVDQEASGLHWGTGSSRVVSEVRGIPSCAHLRDLAVEMTKASLAARGWSRMPRPPRDAGWVARV